MSSHLGLLQIRLKHMLTQGVAEQGYAGSSFRNHNTANSSQLTTNLDNLNRMVVAEPLEAQVVFVFLLNLSRELSTIKRTYVITIIEVLTIFCQQNMQIVMF